MRDWLVCSLILSFTCHLDDERDEGTLRTTPHPSTRPLSRPGPPDLDANNDTFLILFALPPSYNISRRSCKKIYIVNLVKYFHVFFKKSERILFSSLKLFETNYIRKEVRCYSKVMKATVS